MIDTDKYKDMHGNEIDVDELLAEVLRLQHQNAIISQQLHDARSQLKGMRKRIKEAIE